MNNYNYLKDDDKNVKFNKVVFNKQNNKNENNNKNKILITISIIALSVSFIYLIFSIFDSFTNVNQVLEIINGVFIFGITLTMIIGFLKQLNFFKIISTIFIILLCIFNILVTLNIIKLPTQSFVPYLINKNVNNAMKWADNNNIDLTQTYEYSDDIKPYKIISQSKEKGTLTKDFENLNIVVSNGQNPEKDATIMNMTGWDIDDAVKIIDKNYLSNVIVDFEISDEYDKDTIISQSIAGTIKRNDELKFLVSLGSGIPEQIKLSNLKNKSLFKATLYLKRNSLTYDTQYKFANKIYKNHVLNTTPKEKSIVKPNDNITLSISKGKKIIVPDLSNMKIDKITKWIIKNNLKMQYQDKYSNNIKKGYIISINYTKGETIEEGTVINVVASKGKLKLPKFKSLIEFRVWAQTYAIKYEESNVFSDTIAKGNIIQFSSKVGTIIDPDQVLTVYISNGKATKVPNLTNKNKNEINKLCSNSKIQCTMSYANSATVADGISISQSKNAGSEVAEGTLVNVVISKGKATTSTKKNSTSSTNKSSTSNNSSTNTNTSCQNITLTMEAGATGNQSKTMIINANPNAKFSFNMVSSCSNNNATSGTVCNASSLEGKTVTTCQNISVTIVE